MKVGPIYPTRNLGLRAAPTADVRLRFALRNALGTCVLLAVSCLCAAAQEAPAGDRDVLRIDRVWAPTGAHVFAFPAPGGSGHAATIVPVLDQALLLWARTAVAELDVDLSLESEPAGRFLSITGSPADLDPAADRVAELLTGAAPPDIVLLEALAMTTAAARFRDGSPRATFVRELGMERALEPAAGHALDIDDSAWSLWRSELDLGLEAAGSSGELRPTARVAADAVWSVALPEGGTVEVRVGPGPEPAPASSLGGGLEAKRPDDSAGAPTPRSNGDRDGPRVVSMQDDVVTTWIGDILRPAGVDVEMLPVLALALQEFLTDPASPDLYELTISPTQEGLIEVIASVDPGAAGAWEDRLSAAYAAFADPGASAEIMATLRRRLRGLWAIRLADPAETALEAARMRLMGVPPGNVRWAVGSNLGGPALDALSALSADMRWLSRVTLGPGAE